MEVSRRPELFASGQSSRPERDSWIPSMINMDDPKHKRRRNLVNRGFTPRRVADHEARIRQICGELIDRVAPLGRCEFVRDLAAPLPMVIIGGRLGVEAQDPDRLRHWTDDLLVRATSRFDESMQARSDRASQEYTAYALGVVADRRRRPRDDLMSILVHSELDGERLDDEALVHESMLILIGGDETTRHVISGGMEALARHPEQRARLVGHPERIPTRVEELLRLGSPVHNMARTTTRDAVVRG